MTKLGASSFISGEVDGVGKQQLVAGVVLWPGLAVLFLSFPSPLFFLFLPLPLLLSFLFFLCSFSVVAERE